jgi:hypothetical protein
MTTHKKHYHRQPNYGVNIKPVMDTTLKFVEVGAATTVGVSAINAVSNLKIK